MFLPAHDRIFPQYDQGVQEAYARDLLWQTGHGNWYEADEVGPSRRAVPFRSRLGDALIALGYRLKAGETVAAQLVERPPFSANGTSS